MKVTIDASEVLQQYRAGFRRLAALEGFDHKAILRAEAGVILKTWAGRTKVANAYTAELFARAKAAKRAFGANHINKNPFGITVNTGRRDGFPGTVWFRTARKKFMTPGVISENGSIKQSHLHFKDDDWARIEAGMVTYANELKKALPAAVKSSGLARQSVIQIADDLGIDLGAVKGGGNLSATGIAKARAAIASNGHQYKNGSGSEGGDAVRCHVELINRLPYNQKAGMDSVLLSIIAGRAKYIERSYQKGAFDSMSRTVKAFPNIFRGTGLDVPPLEDAA